MCFFKHLKRSERLRCKALQRIKNGYRRLFFFIETIIETIECHINILFEWVSFVSNGFKFTAGWQLNILPKRWKQFEHLLPTTVLKGSYGNIILGRNSTSQKVLFLVQKKLSQQGCWDRWGHRQNPSQKSFWDGIRVFWDGFFRPKNLILL